MKLQRLDSRKVFGLGLGMAVLLPAICSAAVPAAPATVEPQSYGFDACPNIKISWSASSGATSYELPLLPRLPITRRKPVMRTDVVRYRRARQPGSTDIRPSRVRDGSAIRRRWVIQPVRKS
jgi:hypothetical protein